MNKAFAEQLAHYNNYVMKKLETSRMKQFLDIEKPFLSPLHSQPYQMREYRKAKVQKMGFIYLNEDINYYSVPFRYIGQQVEVQYDSDSVRSIIIQSG